MTGYVDSHRLSIRIPSILSFSQYAGALMIMGRFQFGRISDDNLQLNRAGTDLIWTELSSIIDACGPNCALLARANYVRSYLKPESKRPGLGSLTAAENKFRFFAIMDGATDKHCYRPANASHQIDAAGDRKSIRDRADG